MKNVLELTARYLADPAATAGLNPRQAEKLAKALAHAQRTLGWSARDTVDYILAAAVLRLRHGKPTLYINNIGSSGSHWLNRLLRQGVGLLGTGEIYVPPRFLERQVAPLAMPGRPVFLQAVYLAHMLSGEARDISSHVSNTAHLLDLGPYARNDIASLGILLIRDPVDIVLSRTLRKPEYRAWLGKAEAKDTEYLEDNIQVVSRFFAAVRPESYDLVCRYEDMVEDPVPVLERICGLLGAGFDGKAARRRRPQQTQGHSRIRTSPRNGASAMPTGSTTSGGPRRRGWPRSGAGSAMPDPRPAAARIAMIVWNTFQNDARVLKEAETLAGQGHALTVFALLQPGETPEHEVLAPGLEVVRVSRTPMRALRRLFEPDGSRPPREVAAGRRRRLRRHAAQELAPAPGGRDHLAQRHPRRALPRPGGEPARRGARPRRRHAADRLGGGAARPGAARLRRARDSTDREGYRELRGLIAWAEGRLMPRADATITTTEMRAKFFARAYGVPRPLVLQNRPRFAEPARGTRIRDRLGLADALPVVLYQGGLQPGRGLEDLVAAVPALPPCHLVFIGGGRLLAALAGMVAERGLGGCVHFVPTVPLAELLAWTASADIGVQPIRNTCLNHFSTDSNKLFEYAMAGLPVVASDFPEIPPGGHENDIGLLFDPETPGALAEALGRLVADADLRARFAANARRAPGAELGGAGGGARRPLRASARPLLHSVLSPAAKAGGGVVAEAPERPGEGKPLGAQDGPGAAGGAELARRERARSRPGSRRGPRRGRARRRRGGAGRARGRSPGAGAAGASPPCRNGRCR